MLFVCPSGGGKLVVVVVANTMSKVYKIIVNPQRPSTSAADASVERETDWDKIKYALSRTDL